MRNFPEVILKLDLCVPALLLDEFRWCKDACGGTCCFGSGLDLPKVKQFQMTSLHPAECLRCGMMLI